MIRQNVKDVCYVFFYGVSILIRPIYYLRYRKKKIKNVHLGCGKKYLTGFLNVDANPQRRVDCWLDIRAGIPLSNESVDFIYSSHMLEHLEINDALCLLREAARVLKSGGVFRLAVPDFNYINRILDGQISVPFPRTFNSRSGQAINFLFCDSQHRYAYSFDLLKELYRDCGFQSIENADSAVNIGEHLLHEGENTLTVNLYK